MTEPSPKILYTADCGCYVTDDHEQHISEGCQRAIHEEWERVFALSMEVPGGLPALMRWQNDLGQPERGDDE